MARRLFRRRLLAHANARGTTREQRRVRTALPSHRGTPVPFYLSHTPSLQGFKHGVISHTAPDTTPVPEDLPALAAIVALSVTSVEGVTPLAWTSLFEQAPAFSKSPRLHLAVLASFQGAGTRGSPLPVSEHASQFGTVSDGTVWQALSGLSWLSFSSPAFAGRRG